MLSKRCSQCGETKTSEEFYRARSKRDGLRPYCKECDSASCRAYKEAHWEEIRAKDRAYKETHREEIRAYKRAYLEEHRDERYAQDRKWKTEARNASREVATRNGEPWTPAEDHVVLTSEGTTLEIAIELGRTTRSIYKRRALLRRKAVTA